jgi:hypothetical protein
LLLQWKVIVLALLWRWIGCCLSFSKPVYTASLSLLWKMKKSGGEFRECHLASSLGLDLGGGGRTFYRL